MQDERLQFTAHEFSRQLLNNFLNDEELRSGVACWLQTLLNDSENELAKLVVRTLQSDVVMNEILRIADNIVSWLCCNTSVQKQVSDLLLVAINLPSAKQGTADWIVEIVNRDDVSEALKQLVNEAVLEDDTVRTHATSLARYVTAAVLNDPLTAQLTQQRLSQVLSNPEFQSQASDAIWSCLKQTFRRPSWLGSIHLGTEPNMSNLPLNSSKAK